MIVGEDMRSVAPAANCQCQRSTERTFGALLREAYHRRLSTAGYSERAVVGT